MSGPYCACLHVKYDAEEVESGLMRERWICIDCGTEFCRRRIADRRSLDIKALRARLEAVEKQLLDMPTWSSKAARMCTYEEHQKLLAAIRGEGDNND